ncbi:MAG: hypothetical protein E5X63_20145 [Mesorhizobium sp.]|uniref:hypothetical protein n=1 Tax=Mesorhizobium sp. TaxID=1871066 RepID=UPI000FE6739E|nr:hypothetical protein [Mesorhizobium sp.]RWF80008.1 MAG: hypothetical protein EOQ36_33250 [Mesorhizobium sp.]TIP83828.1 MAG: hypothetical protein E5X63_20145 [Mesorhizobium sp.]TJW50097.1 MAG: hypothetical protein E5X65_30460 [Mesorhizobium sp.]
METFTKVTLYTDKDGYARFREKQIAFVDGPPGLRLTGEFPCKSCQLRHSPVGFRLDFHVCGDKPLWVAVLQGILEITLQDGTSRQFMPGDCFYAADVLPAGATFDPEVHGHQSRQVGDAPLVTLFANE